MSELLDELDRDCLWLSGKTASLYNWTYGLWGQKLIAPLEPGKFDNQASRIKELGVRLSIVVGSLIAVVYAGLYLAATGIALYGASRALKAAGLYLQKDHFTHVKGKAPETLPADGRMKILSWNIQGKEGLPYPLGLSHWNSRLDAMMETIVQSDAHIVVLRNVEDLVLREKVIARLKNQYAHFYLHMEESGYMILTKCPVECFKYAPCDSSQHGIALLEAPGLRIMGAQIDPISESLQKEERTTLLKTLAAQKTVMPTLFVGDLGVDFAQNTMLSPYLQPCYLKKDPTYTNEPAQGWVRSPKEERISDTIALFQSKHFENGELPVIVRNVQLRASSLLKSTGRDAPVSDHRPVFIDCSIKGR